jgi:hypothetical protein
VVVKYCLFSTPILPFPATYPASSKVGIMGLKRPWHGVDPYLRLVPRLIIIIIIIIIGSLCLSVLHTAQSTEHTYMA